MNERIRRRKGKRRKMTKRDGGRGELQKKYIKCAWLSTSIVLNLILKITCSVYFTYYFTYFLIIYELKKIIFFLKYGFFT